MADNFDKSMLLESFLDEVGSYLPEISANLDRLHQTPGDSAALEETYRRTHTIGGSAAMMEFAGLARVASGMEELLGDALDHNTPLDAPTIALLRRSHSRLARLIEKARAGADETELVREDDADHAAWRGSQPASAPAAQAPQAAPPAAGAPVQIPDWLAAFAAPGTVGAAPGAAPERAQPMWPDAADAMRQSSGNGSASPPQAGGDPWAQSLTQQPTGAVPVAPFTTPPSSDPPANGHGAAPRDFGASMPGTAPMLEVPSAGAAQPPWHLSSADAPENEATAALPSLPTAPGGAPPFGSSFGAPFAASATSSVVPPWAESVARDVGQPSYAASAAAGMAPSGDTGALLAPLDDLRVDEAAVRRQVATLRDTVVALREAAQAMEDERGELRGFLDGSKDALERLEEWAGQQMGLDLRRSPDAVRRFLPLSVIWVTTTRLKKLVSLLHASSRTLTSTQEQVEETLDELRQAINQTGRLFGGNATLAGAAATGQGFVATVAQVSWAPPVEPERHEAAAATLTPGARAELERTVREELRRELEDEVREEMAAEVRRMETQRLRHELEIQVRRELLSDLAPGLGSSAITVHEGNVEVLPQMPFMAAHSPRQVRVTSEQSPEALAVFQDEAQEHLQSITEGIAQLERAPGEVDVLRGIRRAMHTLKGAAGMMGFATVQEIAHASEDLLEQLADGKIAFSAAVLGLLLETSETLDHFISGQTTSPEEQQRTATSLVQRYAALTGMPVAAAVPVSAAMAPEPEPLAEHDGAASGTADLSVRLQLSKLDDLVNLFGELLINRSVVEERVDRILHLVTDSVRVSERLRDVGRQLDLTFETAMMPAGEHTGILSMGGAQAGQRGPANAARGSAPMAPGSAGRTGGTGPQWDHLEMDQYNEFHVLSRGLGESVEDIVTLTHELETLVRDVQTSFARENRMSSEFQDRLLKARLVPLQSLVPRLYRATRASALKEGKEVEFFVEGGETEVDRKVFEEVEGPLLHLVRNAVNHGMERPDARELAGKPRTGKLVVSAAYEGNQVVIAVRDDGAGIDPERIRQKAVERGWIDPYTHLNEQEAISLIFRAGVSTAGAVTEESGRGVGLDVVRDAVTRLRGTVEVDSAVGRGTTFTLKFPISLQIARAVLVKVGTQTLAIPMVVVSQIGRLDYYQRVSTPTPAIEMRGERYPLVHLASYLRLPANPLEERSSVLLVNAGRHRVALVVDAVESQKEVVSKPLGTHLRDVRGVAGATVLGNGQVVLILELHELLAQAVHATVTLPAPRSAAAASPLAPTQPPATAQPTAPMPAQSAPGRWSQPGAHDRSGAGRDAHSVAIGGDPSRGFVVMARPTGTSTGDTTGRLTLPPATQAGYVLVVDDSPSVRRVVSNMLKASGWTVQTARDGLEALEAIAHERPAAILLDIEMPRMDGYELMATVRSQEQYRKLPLIVLTSRAATKHQQRAIQLGADAYLVKPYQDEELLTTLATLVRARG